MINIESKDLILMLLEGFEEFKEEKEVPSILTPRKITRTVGVEDTEPYSVLNEMEEEDLISEEGKYISGSHRRRNVYFLTEKGRKKEKKLWNEIKNENFTILTEEDEKNLKLKNIESHISGRNPIVKGLRETDEQNTIDLTEIESDPEVFVGRKKELKELQEELKKVKKEGAKTVLIKGEAGIGKTSLVSKLRPFAEELGFEILSGRCQSEASDPYLPFKEAFTEYMDGNSNKQKGGSMAFMGVQQESALKDKNIFDAQKKETFYDTSKYIRELAEENPLFVFLDDLHWVDKATLEILTYMDEKLENSPILFLGTYRPEDISKNHKLTEMIKRLERGNRLKTIDLKPLTYEDTEKAIKGIVGEDDIPQDFVEIIHRKTDGNPLFIKEAIRQMIEENIIDLENEKYPHQMDDISISGLVHNVIGRRINRLDDETVKVVKIGSVIGDSIPFDLLTNTVEMSEINLLDHIDMLTGNNIWEEDLKDEKFYFSHEMIKDTVYKNVRGLKKKVLHEKAAENIEKLYEKELEEWYSDLARHHCRAENFSKALEYYIKEGGKAERAYANEDAIEMYEDGLDLCDKAGKGDEQKLEIIKKITKAYSLLGEYEDARKYLNMGLEFTEDERGNQKIYRRIAQTYDEQADWDKAFDYIEKGLSASDIDSPETCKLLSLEGMVYIQRGDLQRAEEIFKKEKEVAERIESEENMGQVYHDIGSTALRKGEIDKSIQKLQEAIEIREETEDMIELQKSYNNLGIASADKADFEKAEEYYRKSLEVCEDIGDKSSIAASLNNLGTIQMKKGEMKKAMETFEESLDISEKLGDKHGKAISMSNLANIYLILGDVSSAESNLEGSYKLAEEIGAKNLISTNLSIEAELKKKEGELELAKDKLSQCKKVAEDTGTRFDLSLSFYEIGDIDLLRGNFEKAENNLIRAKKISEKLGAKEIDAATRDALAKINLRKKEKKKSIEQHREGLEIAKGANDVESIIQNQIGLGEDFLEAKEIEKSKKYSSKAGKNLEGRKNPELYIRNQLLNARIKREIEKLDKAETHLKNALEKSREAKDKTWKARSLYQFGLLFLKQNDDGNAIERLEKANSMFESMGMKKWKERTQEKLNEV